MNQRFAALVETLDAKCEALLAMSPVAAVDVPTGTPVGGILPVLRGQRAPLRRPHEAVHPRTHTESIRCESECGFVSLADCPRGDGQKGHLQADRVTPRTAHGPAVPDAVPEREGQDS